jgi:hypothetical protein
MSTCCITSFTTTTLGKKSSDSSPNLPYTTDARISTPYIDRYTIFTGSKTNARER